MFEFEPLDLAVCYGNDLVSRVISLGTASLIAPARLRLGPSHVAVLCQHDTYGMLWVESTSLCDHSCLITGRRENGSQAHFPEDRIRDYEQSGGHVELYRLAPVFKLSTDESQLLSRILIHHFVEERRGYDTRGAILSGTRFLQMTQFFPGADLESLFCSEMAAFACQRVNRMNHSNPSRFNPARLIREQVRNGIHQFCKSGFRIPNVITEREAA